MSDSDDEPLSVVKQKLPSTSQDTPVDLSPPKKMLHKKRLQKKLMKKQKPPAAENVNVKDVKITLNPPSATERAHDVWLYIRDLNLSGPYSCLLCHEWFINRSKMVIHYLLNHKKDYCGICRYFVDNREAWNLHAKNHIPVHCPRCPSSFQNDFQLRSHFYENHDAVQCRFCGNMSSLDSYCDHLFTRHSISNVANKENPSLWEVESDRNESFSCKLCVETTKPSVDFYNHYVCFHKLSIKSFCAHLSGYDVPFAIFGANITTAFIENELKYHPKVGYVDPEKTLIDNSLQESNYTLLQALIPEIKQEIVSDSEEKDPTEISVDIKVLNEDGQELTAEEKAEKENAEPDPVLNYKGEEDFDVTLTEVIIINKAYIEYMNLILKSYESKMVAIESKIAYNSSLDEEIVCNICLNPYSSIKDLCRHMVKMHGVKILPNYICRLCMAMYDTEAEFRTHIALELKDFDDLWICQFCDKEFDGREDTRKHLTDHWTELNNDNCFSPHLGFKCRYCPTLFWNEIEREDHQNRIHFEKHKEDFYKCNQCENSYSDKLWFLHHYSTAHSDALPDHYMLKCAICTTVFNNVQDIRLHFQCEHPEARKIFCSLGICKLKPFSRNKSFKIHIQTFHGRDPKPQEDVQCVVCGKMFENARACSSHATLAHAAGRFKCRICHTALHTMDERKLHELLQHPQHKPWTCKVCGRGFKHKSGMYMHQAEHRAPAHFACARCGKTFPKKESLREHALIHEGPRHSCSYCPMTFVQRSNMLRHERRHTGEKPYSCTHCGRGFSDKGAANSHMRTHVPGETHPCPYCGQRFVQRSKLVYHMRRHTGEDLEACPLCSKLFTNVYALRHHLRTHERGTHQCNLCGKSFGQSFYLDRHVQKAHETRDRDRKCPLCDFSATNISALRIHVLTHSTVKHITCCVCSKAYNSKKSVIQHLEKSHNFKGTGVSLKHLYTVLNPYQCGLNLDSETIESIFGKKLINNYETDVVVGEYFTIKDVPVEYNKNSDGERVQSKKRKIKLQKKTKKIKRERNEEDKREISSENEADKRVITSGNEGDTRDRTSENEEDNRYRTSEYENEEDNRYRTSEYEGDRQRFSENEEDKMEPTDLVCVKIEAIDSENNDDE